MIIIINKFFLVQLPRYKNDESFINIFNYVQILIIFISYYYILKVQTEIKKLKILYIYMHNVYISVRYFK